MPDSYVAKYASQTWAGTFPLIDSGQVDVFSESEDRFFLVAATRLPAGTTLREWARSHAEVMHRGFPFCTKARAFRMTKLGGGSAREFLGKCLTHEAIVVASVHRARGYTFQFVSLHANTSAPDRRIFEAARRSFRFTK